MVFVSCTGSPVPSALTSQRSLARSRSHSSCRADANASCRPSGDQLMSEASNGPLVSGRGGRRPVRHHDVDAVGPVDRPSNRVQPEEQVVHPSRRHLSFVHAA